MKFTQRCSYARKRDARGEPNKTASYSRLLDLLGVRGNTLGARNTRRALSSLILGEFASAPRVERVSRGQYRLAD
jgi:hypothetical protein